MEKIDIQTPNLVEENIEKLIELFPQVAAEVENEQGEVERSVDYDALRELLGDVAEGTRERYQFTWPGKREAKAEAYRPLSKTMRPCPEESVDWDTTENLYIEGDNLDALKILRETYAGKIKMIYIDPPYNTGSDFIYDDDFSQTKAEYVAVGGGYSLEGGRLVSNLSSNGRFHSDWCSMMYPRLVLARDLLSTEGVMFVSIDDNELENIKRICDEIFGESNFVGCLILQTATDNNPRQINTEHEYILCYAKNKRFLESWQAESEKAQLIKEKYKELKLTYGSDLLKLQKELRVWIKKNSELLKGVTHYDNVDEKGVFHDGDIANTVFGGYDYEVIHPITGKPCKIPEKGFRFAEKTMKQMIEAGEIMFGADETTLIKPKKRLENARDVLRSVIYEDGRASTKQFEALMARDIFQNPKSPMILERLINFIVKPGDIVMDFFSGTATTAEAVMRLNAKCPEKQQRYIMVQLPENLDESVLTASSRAKKTLQNAINFLNSIDKPHSICEIGKERIRRAGTKITAEINKENEQLKLGEDPRQIPDIGFRVLKIDSSNINDVLSCPEDTMQTSLLETADNIKDDRTEYDLLFQVLPKFRISYSADIRELTFGGKRVFSVEDGLLVACFDKDVTTETIEVMAKLKPSYAVMRDMSFDQDDTLSNFEELFKTFSPDTIRRVI